ncbi:hypothetical protein [Robbsia sp. KACC 23696]|uniref:hypothetical protein n=1 Tax=Robbsia sp. KACC 23696 TaxID=3149231 RepID=UPI00325A5A2C
MFGFSHSTRALQEGANVDDRASHDMMGRSVSVDSVFADASTEHADLYPAIPLHRPALGDAMVGASLRAIGRRRTVVDEEDRVWRSSVLVPTDAVVRGALFSAGGDGQLFDTNVPGFLLKEAKANTYFDPEAVIRGGEVECFQAMYGVDSARHIGRDTFLIRKFSGDDLGRVDAVLTVDDARNLLKHVSEMHARGIVHGDITNANSSLVKNVLFDRDTQAFHIIDFGNSVYFKEESMSSDDAQARFSEEYARVRESILYMMDLLGSPEAETV